MLTWDGCISIRWIVLRVSSYAIVLLITYSNTKHFNVSVFSSASDKFGKCFHGFVFQRYQFGNAWWLCSLYCRWWHFRTLNLWLYLITVWQTRYVLVFLSHCCRLFLLGKADESGNKDGLSECTFTIIRMFFRDITIEKKSRKSNMLHTMVNQDGDDEATNGRHRESKD